jgi:transposase-like protein
VRAYREIHASDEPRLELSERARLRELERQNRELEMENAFLKKRQRTLRGSLGEQQIRLHRR